MLGCSSCNGAAQLCDRCLDDRVAQIRGVAEVRGERWGESVRARAGGRRGPEGCIFR